ncbi:hypothetical protein ACOSQ3_019356 [Xanthoceras sorbifolium]
MKKFTSPERFELSRGNPMSHVPFAKTNFAPNQKPNSFLANTSIILTASSPGSLSILPVLSAGSNYQEQNLEVVELNGLIKCICTAPDADTV